VNKAADSQQDNRNLGGNDQQGNSEELSWVHEGTIPLTILPGKRPVATRTAAAAGTVWEYHCESRGVPVGEAWLPEIKRYESEVLSKRA
jgi:hypothetical protein